MPDIYPSDDGYLKEIGGANADRATAFNLARNVATANNQYNSTNAYMGQTHSFGKGVHSYVLYRVYMSFDTSGISVTPANATLKIRGSMNAVGFDESNFFVVKSDYANSPVAVADWDAIVGWQGGLPGVDESSNVTKYSDEVDAQSSWNVSNPFGFVAAYNEITLNSNALSDMVSLDNFKICLIGKEDLTNDDTEDDLTTRMFHSNQSGTDRDPLISYTAGAAGYGNSVMGVASGNISKINGIATANISKVNGA